MIVAVDEADDLFAGVDEDNAATRHGSKVFMNRLVERVASADDLDRQRHRSPRSGGGSPHEPRHAVPQAQPGRAQEDDRAHRRTRRVPPHSQRDRKTRASSGGAGAD